MSLDVKYFLIAGMFRNKRESVFVHRHRTVAVVDADFLTEDQITDKFVCNDAKCILFLIPVLRIHQTEPADCRFCRDPSIISHIQTV